MFERVKTSTQVSEILNALVRPTLAIMFGGTIVYMAIVGTVTSGEFLGIAAVVVGFFFQSRQEEKAQQRMDKQEETIVELAKAAPPGTP